jgi:hypothetical protein
MDEFFVPVSDGHSPYILCLTEHCMELPAIWQVNIEEYTIGTAEI